MEHFISMKGSLDYVTDKYIKLYFVLHYRISLLYLFVTSCLFTIDSHLSDYKNCNITYGHSNGCQRLPY